MSSVALLLHQFRFEQKVFGPYPFDSAGSIGHQDIGAPSPISERMARRLMMTDARHPSAV